MGYTLAIGEAKIFYDNDEDLPYCKIDVEKVEHKNAPSFGEPTDGKNERWPSYTSWSDFADFAGLKDLFFDKEDGLIASHPGCIPLTKKHKEIIDKAYNAYKAKWPNGQMSLHLMGRKTKMTLLSQMKQTLLKILGFAALNG